MIGKNISIKKIIVLLVLITLLCLAIFFSQGKGKFSYNIVAAGDIASLDGGQAKTARVVLSLNPDKVLTLGDNAYENGSLKEFYSYYDPTWGLFKSITAPSPGNHEYQTENASGYYDYFGDLAGEKGKGYYSFDLGSWHIISLNSEKVDEKQLTWLTKDLKTTYKPCILAYWHKPLFSSGGEHGNDKSSQPFWDTLYSKGVDVILTGHDHDYERFAKQNPHGQKDEKGIREFVVGTGGGEQRGMGKVQKNSEIRMDHIFGVLQMNLKNNGYDASFINIDGKIKDMIIGQKCNPK